MGVMRTIGEEEACETWRMITVGPTGTPRQKRQIRDLEKLLELKDEPAPCQGCGRSSATGSHSSSVGDCRTIGAPSGGAPDAAKW